MLPDSDIAALFQKREPRENDLRVSCSRARVEQLLFGRARSHVAIAGAHFDVIGRLGAGGMGTVYEVEQVGREGRLALKLLHDQSNDHAFRLKREFRTLAHLAHPNLVSLFELFADDAGCAFTMELLRGVDFLTFTRREGQADLARLHKAVCDIARGLCALHDAGIIHRDLKPNNVLITDEGRAVLLDFGVALEGPEREVAGTLHFMPEEQRRGNTVQTSDLYALGLMIELALFGSSKDRVSGDLPRGFHAWIELVDRLCARDERARPSAAELLSLLDATARPVKRFPRVKESLPLRENELDALTHATGARSRHPRLVLVEGVSGIGKSVLRDQWLSACKAEQPDVFVLSGRCSRREAVPYRALDPLIDALSAALLSVPELLPEESLPNGMGACSELFPVLKRVPAIRARAAGEAHVADARERRRVGVSALRTLLVRLSRERGVVLAIDDAQWLDRDSLELLQEITSMPDAPPLLTVAFSRPITSQRHPIEALFEDVVRIPLAKLTDEQTTALARHLLPDRPEHWQRVSRLGEGSPFLCSQVCELLREGQGEAEEALPSALEQRFERLGTLPRRVLELVVTAAEPMSVSLLSLAAGERGVDFDKALHVLEAQRYVRTAGTEDLCEPYHDKVSEFVAFAVSPDAKTSHHLALARALETDDVIKRSRSLLFHYRAAGEAKKAARYARIAADQARARLLFREAAELYETSQQLWPEHAEQRALRLARADMLDAAGLDREAASVLAELAQSASNTRERFELSRRAAELLFRGGHAAEALATMDPLLAEVGLSRPRSTLAHVASALLHRARLARRGYDVPLRNESEVDPLALSRVDACTTLTIGHGGADVILGFDFTSRALLHALDCGEPTRLGKALIAEAVLRSTFKNAAGFERALQKAGELAELTNDDRLRVHTHFARAQCAYVRMDMAQTRIEAERSIQIAQEKLTGVAAHLSIARYVWFLGRLAQGDLTVREEIAESLRDAIARGDKNNEVSFRVGFAGLHLLAGDSSRCRAEVREVIRDERAFDPAHWTYHVLLAQADLYDGRPREALARLDAADASFRKHGLLYVPFIRICTAHLSALSSATAPFASRQRRVLRIARRLEREPFAAAKAIARQLKATLRAHESPHEAAAELEQIATTFAEQHLFWYAQATRLYAYDLRGDVERSERLERELVARGVREPRRYLTAFAPFSVEVTREHAH